MDIRTDDIINLGRRISAELGTTIKIELEDIELPLQSSIVGMENERYIIIKAPEPFQRIRHKLYPGNEMIVRYISDGTVFAFQTRMIETIVKPIPLIFVEYPKIIQHYELRNQKRVPCHLPTRVIFEDQENIGCIVDMARTGCRLLIQAEKNPKLTKFDLENEVILESIFPGSKEVVSLDGVVKNIKRTRKEVDLGILFHGDTSDENQKTLNWFLASIDGFSK